MVVSQPRLTLQPQAVCLAQRLSALWDAAFDKGLISFADDGTPVASQQLSEAARAALTFGSAPRLAGLRDAHIVRLRRHRAATGFLCKGQERLKVHQNGRNPKRGHLSPAS